MRLDRFLPERLQHMAPEAIAFAAIGLGNLVLYFLIYNVLIFIGPVKSTIIATVVTTYLAYLANRHWTYKNRPKRAVRREYTMFFAVNMVGLLIQATGNSLLKYGLDMSERRHQLLFNLVSALCICIATLFRFWTYRTFVFKDEPAGSSTTAAATTAGAATAGTAADVAAADGAAVNVAPPIVAPAEGLPLPHNATAAEFEQLAASLEAALKPDGQSAEGVGRTR